MDVRTGLLPGGYVDAAGEVHRAVQLAPLGGWDEALLAEANGQPHPALVTAILSRCVQRLGTISPVPEQVARHLLVADRQYLLLRLREVTFGPRLRSTIVCPGPECRARIDIDFSTKDIPIRESEHKGPVYQMELSPEAVSASAVDQTQRQVRFRLPNGADQEVLAPVLAESEEGAADALLRRCIQSIGSWEQPTDRQLDALSLLARAEIEAQMATVAPHVELTMEGDCPECGRPFTLPFDLVGAVLGELRISQDLLYREVHYLAFHYHWSEREILDMPRARRRKYIQVLAEEIERLNDGA
jgi:hypothetical protein